MEQATKDRKKTLKFRALLLSACLVCFSLSRLYGYSSDSSDLKDDFVDLETGLGSPDLDSMDGFVDLESGLYPNNHTIKCFDDGPMINLSCHQSQGKPYYRSISGQEQVLDHKLELLALAKEITQKHTADSYSHMRDVLSQFSQIDPDLSLYINHQGIFTLDGMRVIQSKLNEIYPDFKAQVCSSADELGMLISEIYHSSESFAGSIIANVTNDLHLTHLYIEKSSSSLDIFFTDSMGFDHLYFIDIVNQIRNIKGHIPINSYEYKKKRQEDGTNCPVFAMTDSLGFWLNPSISKFLKSKSKFLIKQDQLSRFEIIDLPPVLMLGTQSLSRISHYTASVSHDYFSRSTLTLKRFGKIIDRYTFPICTKKQNKLTEFRFKLYAYWVLSFLVN